MRIMKKHQIHSSGSYSVMEGTVATDNQDEVRLCWVEDEQGNHKSDFTDADTATSIAQALSEQEDSDSSNESSGDAGHGSDSGDSGGDGGGNGGD